jgi:hypothetical protein
VSVLGRWVVALTVVLAACAQVLDLDDLHDRVTATTPDASDADAGDAGAEGGRLECTTNAECLTTKASEGSTDGWACESGKCVALRLYDGGTPVCYQNAFPSNAALADPNSVLIAAFVPMANASFDSEPVMKAYRLALEELLPEKAGQGWPKLAMVACSSDEKNSIVDQGVDHVINDLHVPIILAGFDPARLSTIAADKTVDAGIYIVNPSVPSESLKYANVQNLVLNLLGAPGDVALAYRPLLQAIELKVRAARDAAHQSDPVKVALIDTKNTLVEAEMARVILNGPVNPEKPSTRDPSKAILFNDAGPFANTPNNGQGDLCAPDAGFCWLPIGDLENNNPKPDYNQIKASLLAFRPDVIIALTRDELGPIVACYERTLVGIDQSGTACPPPPGDAGVIDGIWGAQPTPAGDAGVRLPYWLLGPRNAEELLPFLPNGNSSKNQLAHSAFADEQQRFFGVQFAGATNTQQRTAWLQRMQERWTAQDLPRYQSHENSYDAVYWAAYGLVAMGPDHPEKDEPLGRALSFGVRRMFGGGPSVIPPPSGVHLSLLKNGNVTFEGALGPADIDGRFNTWNSVGGVYCYKDDGVGTTSAPVVPTISYDARRYADGGLIKRNDRECFANQP